MTSATEQERTDPTSRVQAFLRGGGVLAVGVAIMNVTTYGFTMVAARLLGPEEYGGVASLMALLLVIGVFQLGLQATAARRISTAPTQVAQIERVVLTATYRAALVLGLVMLVLSPVVWKVLRLESIVPALLLAVAAVPVTISGGQVGVLQGERRWAALATIYLGLGVPRLVVGTVCILIRPTEAAAMLGVTLASFVPVAIGWAVLRHGREPEEHAGLRLRDVAIETMHGSVALLAFFTLSNVDIIVARNVMDGHEAGLYAGGLILTKAVLFLPQFVVVLAFPSMSSHGSARKALLRSLAFVLAAGVASILGAWLLSDVAMIFIGGEEYAEVESRLWVFAVLGTLLAALQLLVYSVLARQSRRAAYGIWAAVVAVVGFGALAQTLDAMVVAVCVIDAVVLVALLALSLWRLRDDAHVGEPAQP